MQRKKIDSEKMGSRYFESEVDMMDSVMWQIWKDFNTKFRKPHVNALILFSAQEIGRTMPPCDSYLEK